MIADKNSLGVVTISDDIPNGVKDLISVKIKETEENCKTEFSEWLADYNLFIINGEVISKDTMDYRLKHYIIYGFLSILPQTPEQANPYWSDRKQVLAKKKQDILYLADFFNDLGFSTTTGYYDPAEDEKDDEVDRLTGFYYMLL